MNNLKLDFFRNHYDCGKGKLAWRLISVDGCLPRLAFEIVKEKKVVDVLRKNVFSTSQPWITTLRVRKRNIKNGFILTTLEESKHCQKGARFEYSYEDIEYVYPS